MNAPHLPSPAAPQRARGRPRQTAEQRDDSQRRHELLAAAARLFRDKGFDATSTRDIAAAVGMHSGSPFYHFKSKDALLFAVMAAGMHAALVRQSQALQVAAAESERPPQQLRRLIRAHFDILHGPGNDFVPVMLYELRALSPEQRSALDQLQLDYEAAWTPVLKALHDAGQLRTPVKLARLLMLGALNWSVKWFDPHKGASLDELTDAALVLFLKDA